MPTDREFGHQSAGPKRVPQHGVSEDFFNDFVGLARPKPIGSKMPIQQHFELMLIICIALPIAIGAVDPSSSWLYSRSKNGQMALEYWGEHERTIKSLASLAAVRAVTMWESFKRASGKQDSPEADRTFCGRRPRYPLSSCVPAELDSNGGDSSKIVAFRSAKVAGVVGS